MKLAENLRKLRGNMSQTAFVSQIDKGLKQTTYSSWERGEKNPPLEMLIKIAQTVDGGVSVDWLLGLSDVKRVAQNENANRDLLLQASTAESELRRYKSAFAKLAKSLKNASEVIEELEGGE